MGIATVAVYGGPDTHALHVKTADIAVPLAGVTAADTYLAGEKVLRAAVDVGADAVHPG